MMVNFEKFDVEFKVDEENYLMIGEDILFESEFMNQVELEEWALNNYY